MLVKALKVDCNEDWVVKAGLRLVLEPENLDSNL